MIYYLKGIPLCKYFISYQNIVFICWYQETEDLHEVIILETNSVKWINKRHNFLS